MSTTQSEARMFLEDVQQGYLEIQQEDWVKDLLNKLAPEERHVVLDAFTDLKRFNRKKSS
ncbi:MAG: hypothetical protein LH702_23780 [Phormidesmis sp. CAN_BIN44]|nr:hypothetical protein [Phormidesmis sp. CAN_BIN44]